MCVSLDLNTIYEACKQMCNEDSLMFYLFKSFLILLIMPIDFDILLFINVI